MVKDTSELGVLRILQQESILIKSTVHYSSGVYYIVMYNLL